jgi:hypothetical protein
MHPAVAFPHKLGRLQSAGCYFGILFCFAFVHVQLHKQGTTGALKLSGCNRMLLQIASNLVHVECTAHSVALHMHSLCSLQLQCTYSVVR